MFEDASTCVGIGSYWHRAELPINPDLFFSIHAPHILHLRQTVFFKLCQFFQRLVFWRRRLSQKESVRSLIWQHPSSAAFHALHLNIAPTTKVRVRNASMSTTIRSSLYMNSNSQGWMKHWIRSRCWCSFQAIDQSQVASLTFWTWGEKEIRSSWRQIRTNWLIDNRIRVSDLVFKFNNPSHKRRTWRSVPR